MKKHLAGQYFQTRNLRRRMFLVNVLNAHDSVVKILLFSVMSQILMSTCHRRLLSNYMMSHEQCYVIRDLDYVYFNLTFVFYISSYLL